MRLSSLLFMLLLAAPLAQGQGLDSFTSTDIGAATGTTTLNGTTLTITSTGVDVWGPADSFRYVHRTQTGDAETTAQVTAYSGPSQWGKTGVMFRENADAGSRFIDLVRTRDNGLEFQYRPQTGADAQTIATARSVTALPVWLRLTREVNRFTAAYKTNANAAWTDLGQINLDLPETLLAGFPTTSGDGSAPGTATLLDPTVEGLACVETAPELSVPDARAFQGHRVALDLADFTFSNACSGAVSYSVVSGGGEIAGNRYRWTPTAPGDFPVTIRATNLGGATDATFTVAVLSLENALPALHVDGNQIRDENGNRVILRGVAVADLKRLNTIRPGQSAASIMARAAEDFGAKVIRMTITPSEWFANPQAYLTDHLDPAIQWAFENEVYVIVDWHYVAGGGEGQDPEYTALDEETRAFWEMVAPRYSGLPNVLYELFNEPATPADWSLWKSFAQPWIDLIRAHALENLLLVSGIWYSSQIFQALDDPFEGENLVYVAHAYPDQAGHTNPNPEEVWQRNWGVVAERFPVILSEWGYENIPGPHWSGGTQTNYGEPLQAFVEARGISWTAWCFDNSWGPKMFNSQWQLLAGDDFHGQFVQDWLLAHQNNDVPVLGLNLTEIDFGLNRAGEPRTETFEITNTGQGPLELTITSDHAQFEITSPDFSAPVTVAVGDTLTVTVHFLSLGGGVQEGTLTVMHNALGRSREIPVFGLSRGTPTNTESVEVPGTFRLEQNYPNPFNPETAIPYQVARPAQITLMVYDMLGRPVATLLDSPQMPGRYTVSFRPTDIATGIYLVEMRADGLHVGRQKLLLVK